MSDEVKVTHEIENEHKCICQSKGFRKFLTIALGTFVGVYFALCLFTALHKPPMMIPHAFGPQGGMMGGCPCKMVHHHHFDKMNQQHRINMPRPDVNQNAPAPFDSNRNIQR